MIRAVLGMLPKNKLRKDILKTSLKIYLEPYHNYGNILPQFTELMPRDINKDTGFDNITPENTIVRGMSAKELPEELKELPIDIDETMDIPITLRKKTRATPKDNMRLGESIKQIYKNKEIKRYEKIEQRKY